jgi:murein DD-endopeptidase MepM/ murein hydrolase activator NlpD
MQRDRIFLRGQRHGFSCRRGGSFLILIFLFVLCACGVSHAPAPAILYGVRGGADSAGMHTVSAEDTLWSISQRYKLSMQDLIAVNHLAPPYQLTSGQRLKLPPPVVYSTRPGDSLYTVARLFNVSAAEISRLNNLRPPYALATGQTLRLPTFYPAYQSPQSYPAQPRVAAASVPAPVVSGHRDKTMQLGAAHLPPAKPVRKDPVETSMAVHGIPPQIPPRASSRFQWPVSGSVISSYGPQRGGLHNDGINIRAPAGAPVRAADNGMVVYAGNELKGFGNLVLVRHADLWMTAYAHMGRLLVKKGQLVKQGQAIGTVGSSGSVSTPQLHFEIRRGAEALNPEAYMAERKM